MGISKKEHTVKERNECKFWNCGFFNGKMDLTKAESINSIIHSNSFLESIAMDDLDEKSGDLEELQEQFLASNDSSINFFKFRPTIANVLNKLMITKRDVIALSAIFLISLNL